jgi:hypothetical protein
MILLRSVWAQLQIGGGLQQKAAAPEWVLDPRAVYFVDIHAKSHLFYRHPFQHIAPRGRSSNAPDGKFRAQSLVITGHVGTTSMLRLTERQKFLLRPINRSSMDPAALPA